MSQTTAEKTARTIGKLEGHKNEIQKLRAMAMRLARIVDSEITPQVEARLLREIFGDTALSEVDT
jgi:hypothetical protein